MSTAGPQGMVNFLILRGAQVQNEMTTIMIDKSDAQRQISDLATEHCDQEALAKYYYENGQIEDQAEYRSVREDLDDEYADQLAVINSWEEELDAQIETYESELTAINTQKEAYQTLKLNNAKSEFSYGGSAS